MNQTRRTMLRGVGGVVLSLPFLECLGEVTDKKQAPVRFGVMFMPNGVNPPDWVPKGVGNDFELSPILTPLKDHHSNITVVSNLLNETASSNHIKLTSAFLCGRNHVGQKSEASIDHLIAQKIGVNSRVPHLRLGTEPPRAQGYLTCSNVSWNEDNVLLAPELNPRVAFDRMFRDFNSPEAKRKAQDQRSILDAVLDRSKSLGKNMSAYDKHKMDQYFSSIRELEERLDKIITPPVAAPGDWKPSLAADKTMEFRPPAEVPDNAEEYMDALIDIMILGMWADNTRVATLMMGHGLSRKNFAFLEGVNNDHHVTSHHRNDPQLLKEYEIICRWHVQRLKRMMDQMTRIDEGGRSLLDNSLILFGAGMSQGNTHSGVNIPVLLAGKAGGAMKTGRHIQTAENTQHSNFLLSVLQKMGVQRERFGKSTGTVDLS
ncbi:MAG: DUF1552 domain-containing protein [Mariniblastus sp.]|nr:DUF1552 domain-containing protein [Mariniblastus sp.]